jgi:gamma-glutamylcyclotransferase (GGCT)/AIG2-like uncharacterized protein YtfP
MDRHLFVYGTLMTAAEGAGLGKPQRARLQREGVSLGAATIQGRLYDLGRYPALVASDRAADQAHGEVFRLTNPISSFRWLDVYENVVPGSPANEYERVVRPVRCSSGGDIRAWVYLYIADLGTRRPVTGGRWQPR